MNFVRSLAFLLPTFLIISSTFISFSHGVSLSHHLQTKPRTGMFVGEEYGGLATISQGTRRSVVEGTAPPPGAIHKPMDNVGLSLAVVCSVMLLLLIPLGVFAALFMYIIMFILMVMESILCAVMIILFVISLFLNIKK